MKLSLLSYSMDCQPKYFTLKRLFEFTAEMKFDGLDLVSLYDTPVRDLRKMADDHGVRIACHTIMTGMGQPDPQVAAQGVEDAKRGIEAAVELGARTVMFPPFPAGPDRDATRRNWIAGFRQVAPFAAAAGVTMTAEHFPGAESPFVKDSDMLEAVREVPGFKVCFDTGNVLGAEDPVASYRVLAPHVAHCHYKDYLLSDVATPEINFRLLNGKFSRGTVIGAGAVNFPAVIAAMKENRYDGYISIEYDDHALPPEEGLRRSVDYLRGIGV